MPNLFKVWKARKKTIRKMIFWNAKVHVYGCVCGFVCDVIVIWTIWSYECYVNNFTHFIRMRNVSRSMKKEFYWRKMKWSALVDCKKFFALFFSTEKSFTWTWINLRLLLILFQVRLRLTLTLFRLVFLFAHAMIHQSSNVTIVNQYQYFRPFLDNTKTINYIRLKMTQQKKNSLLNT